MDTPTPEAVSQDVVCDVLIVGAGASGTLLAAQLARQTPPPRVLVLDGDQSAGRGAAYRTACTDHLLNVPARGMTALADEPQHFHQWLTQRLPGASAGTFASRSLYGDYLHELLAEACARGSTTLRADRAVAAHGLDHVEHADGPRWRVRLSSGVHVQADQVVLAWGNFTPAPPPGCEAVAGPEAQSLFINDPWRSDLANGLTSGAGQEQAVLMLGSGLTMYDVALALRQRGHRGPLHALSRHGRVPHAHAVYPACELSGAPPLGSPRAAAHWLRGEAERVMRAGGNWRAVIDAVRPHNQALWQSWTLAQKRAFMRHLRGIWDVHRHRAAPEIAQRVEAMRQTGELTLHRGRLASIEPVADGAVLARWTAPDGQLQEQRYARVINCTGLSSDYRALRQDLIAQLREAGWLSPDPLGLGILTTPAGQLLASTGQPAPGLYTLGPPRRAQLWESIAVPELRVQAVALAERLAGEARRATTRRERYSFSVATDTN
jgi:uncharacterized NAD(P)/FAD-binding protein YdhS